MQNPEEAAEIKKKRTFRKFSFRGIDLDQYVAFDTSACSMHARYHTNSCVPHKMHRQVHHYVDVADHRQMEWSIKEMDDDG